jgi:hypothetical protein
MDIALIVHRLSKVERALAKVSSTELRGQTPPNGDGTTYYFCPACGEERETRGDMRAHLAKCPDYRAFVVGSVRRRDLEEG